ncbi:MAG: BolA family transcriptional regulator [Proteobacteria bacterium]|nr:BolA family transcriptional regulator [Pseudomonadota bacterium]
MSRQSRIADTLTRAFSPQHLEVEDDSARHAGHAGAGAGGETHFNVRMAAASFEGMSRVARQRAVNEALAAEFAGGLHALSLTLRAPSELAAAAAAAPA